jgi:hypothetical protein
MAPLRPRLCRHPCCLLRHEAMESAGISPEALNLLRECIESYEHLVALLWLRRQDAGAWTAEEVARGANVSRAVIHQTLEQLCAHRLLVVGSDSLERRYAFSPATVEARLLVDELVRFHDENLYEVVALLNGQAIDRIRNAAVRAFADPPPLGRREGGRSDDGRNKGG